MLPRNAVRGAVRIPPFAHLVVRVLIIVDKHEDASFSHPIRECGVDAGGEWFLASVAQEQDALRIEKAGERHILKLNWSDGEAALEQRKSEAVEVRHIRIA